MKKEFVISLFEMLAMTFGGIALLINFLNMS